MSRHGTVGNRLHIEKLAGTASTLVESRVLQVDVSREEELVAGEAPHVEVIDGSNSGQSKDVSTDDVSPDLIGGALHEIVNALREGRHSREHDKDREEEGAEGIDNQPLGLEHDNDGSDDDADGLEQVTDQVSNGSLHVNVLSVVIVMVVVMIMMMMRVSVIMAMVVVVMVTGAAAVLVVMSMIVLVLLVSMLFLLGEALEELVRRVNFVGSFNIGRAHLGLQVQVIRALLFGRVHIFDGNSVMVVVMMIVAVRVRVTMAMTVIVSSAAARSVVMRAVATVRLEHTGDVVEDAVAVLTAAAAMANDDQVDNVTNERDDRSDEHDLGVQLNLLVVHNFVYSHNGLNDEPGDQDPDDKNTCHGAEHLSAVEAEGVLLSGRPLGSVDRSYADHEGRCIRKHMSSVRHDGHGVGDPATDELEHHEHEADARDEEQLIQRRVALLKPLVEVFVISEEAVRVSGLLRGH